MTAGEDYSNSLSTHNNNNNSNTSYSCHSSLMYKGQHSIMDMKLSSSSSSSMLSRALSSSSYHSRDSSTASVSSSSTSSLSRHSRQSWSSSSGREGRRQVAFDQVDIIELAVELGDHPCCTRGPAVQTSGVVERRLSLTLQDFETQRSPLRRSAPELHLSSQDRMKLLHLDVSSRIESLPTSSASKSKCQDMSVTEERILEVDKRVDSLLERMELLDQSMARRSRLRQQRQRAKRAALVVARTGRHSTSCLESS